MKILALLLLITLPAAAEHHELWVDKEIYQVWYDETLEQPIKVTYWVSNRPKNADRKGMNFYKESDFHTSDNNDYYKNVWDKGHIAPAAHFSDSEEKSAQIRYRPGPSSAQSMCLLVVAMPAR